MIPELHSLAQIFTERLLNSAAEGVLLTGGLWVLLRVIGRQNSGTRFAVWFSALFAIVALPFFSGASFMASHLPLLHPANLARPIVLSPSLALCFFTTWVAGAGLLLLRLSLGLWRVRHFRRNCSELDLASLDPSITSVHRDLQSGRRVKLCVSRDATIPAAFGFFQPAIVFPAWLLPQLSAGEIKIILLHELAHLRRWDDWTNLAQKIVKALFFFHPAVWWIENRLTLDREMACDDIVMARTASPRAYASSLISFAEKLESGRALALAQALVSHIHQISLRVTQILDANRPSRTAVWKPMLGVWAVLLALVLSATPYIPPLVAFGAQPGHSPTQPVRMAQRDLNAAERFAGVSVVRAERVAQHARPLPPVRAITAAFHPRTTMMPLRVKVKSLRQRAVMRATAAHENRPIQETIVILQTSQYDASRSGVWTLCIWRIGGKAPAETRLESAIFVASI